MRSETETYAFNPFPGLRPFLPDESNLFFGRDHESLEITEKLFKNRYVTVTGGTGIGKSSIINCGVLQGIKKSQEGKQSDWLILSLRPGNDPFGNLADAISESLLSSGEKVDKGTIITELQNNPDGIIGVLRNLKVRSDARLLIIIDQFEDLFRYSIPEKSDPDRVPSAWFVDFLVDSVDPSSDKMYMIIGMSSDYIGECARYQGLTQLINSSNYLVPHLGANNFRELIEGPVRNAGAHIDGDLVETLLKEIGSRPEQLPLLQHAMMRTWNRWRDSEEPGRPISTADYIATGTMSSSFSWHADEIYNELDASGKSVCRLMFQAITGKASDNRIFRHPSTIGRVKAIAGCSGKDMADVIEKFNSPSMPFIVPHFKELLNENSVIDISSENIIYSWERLKVWVDEEYVSAEIFKRLSEASAMFQKGKTSFLKNPDLQIALNWRETVNPVPEWAERYDNAFERAIVYLRTSEKEFNEEEEIKLKKLRKTQKKNKNFLFILGILVLVSIGLVFVSVIQKAAALKQSTDATAKAVLAEKSVLIAGDLLEISDSNAAAASNKEKEAEQLKEVYFNQKILAEQNAYKARTQKNIAYVRADSAFKELEKAKISASISAEQKEKAERNRMISLGKSMAIKSLQMNDHKDLQTLLAYQAYIFNKANGGSSNDADIFAGLYNIGRLTGNRNFKSTFESHCEIKSIAFIPGKREFFTSGTDGKVLKWDLDGKNQNLQVVYSGSEIINVIAVSPDAGWLALGEAGSGIKMIPLRNSDKAYELNGHSGSVKSIIFSYDGRFLYSSSLDGKVLKWDLSTKVSTVVSAVMMQITSIDISADNRYVAGISSDGKAMVWNPETTSDNFRIGSPGKIIRTMRFKPDENKIAIGYADGYVELWDLSTRTRISEIKAHNSDVTAIKFNTGLSQMATAGTDRTVRLWDLNDIASLPVTFDDYEGFIVSIEFSPDGQVLLSGTTGGNKNLTCRPVTSDILANDIGSLVTRNFTEDEWKAYVGKDVEYSSTIPDAERKIKIDVLR